MQFNKPQEWGSRFHFPENTEVSMDGFVEKVTEKMACEMAEKYDAFILASIANAARAAGVSDLTVLNKAAILEAIEKQIPKAPLPEDRYYGNGKCPRCAVVFLDKSTRYCGNCGQALDWSVDDEE